MIIVTEKFCPGFVRLPNELTQISEITDNVRSSFLWLSIICVRIAPKCLEAFRQCPDFGS